MNLQVRLSIRNFIAVMLLIVATMVTIDAAMQLIEWRTYRPELQPHHSLMRGYAEISAPEVAPRGPASRSFTFEQVRRLFNFDLKGNLTTYLAAFNWTTIGILMLIIGFRSHQLGRKVFIPWVGAGLLFIYFAADNTGRIHDKLGGPGSLGTTLNAKLGLTSIIHFDWVIPFAIFLLAVLPFFIPFFLKLPQRTLWLFVASGLILMVSQMGLETFAGDFLVRDKTICPPTGDCYIQYGFDTLNYHWESLLEDGIMKPLGLILFIFTLLIHDRDYIEAGSRFKMAADLPVLRQLLALPVLRILRPAADTPAAPLSGAAAG